MILSTLEFKHPTLENGTMRHVNDSVDLSAKLENGELAKFIAGQFEIQLPEKGSTGQEILQVVVPNSRELVEVINAIKKHEPVSSVTCVYREYDDLDLNQPRNKPIVLTTSSVQITPSLITLTNSWMDLTNRKFMRRVYTTATHPGLKYL